MALEEDEQAFSCLDEAFDADFGRASKTSIAAIGQVAFTAHRASANAESEQAEGAPASQRMIGMLRALEDAEALFLRRRRAIRSR